MTLLLSGVLGGALVLHAAGAVSNGLQTAELVVSQTNAPAEKEYEKLLADEEAARGEVNLWHQENKWLAAKGIGTTQAQVERRSRERFEPIDKAYVDFLRRHPNHIRARLSYGCFLNDRQDEAGAQAQWEKALELQPENADAYNNLAGRYSEIGPAKKAFEFYSKAIELKPSEAIYYHNFADAIYVLRSHAMTNYGLSEQQVFCRALGLYSNAVRLDPQNFTFASDWAQTYYAVKPLPYAEALKAWTNALTSATNEGEHEDVYLHLARVKMLAGRLGEARAQLNSVTNESCAGLKAALLGRIEERQKASRK
ncbi:MAG TPA: hypothetical protein VNZ64_04325 [Candidatus Acidoferrum sp.]|jgi:tetratricopeptide (TPR) repeat protein|nr:hypothetical protein [Candidatus Acidoferrum sp.]